MGRRRKRVLTEEEQWKEDLRQERLEEERWVEHLGTRNFMLYRLAECKGQEVCTDEDYTYYSVMFDGFNLMYRKASKRPDGRKMFMLTEPLATLMGFDTLGLMRVCLKSIQWWRGWVSTQRLRKALAKYLKCWNR